MRVKASNYPGESNPTPALVINDGFRLSHNHIENVRYGEELGRPTRVSFSPRRPQDESFPGSLLRSTPANELFIQDSAGAKRAVDINGDDVASHNERREFSSKWYHPDPPYHAHR
jgi:hypothetical protein